MAGSNDSLANLVRASDRDRYLATLYAPEDKRPVLFALYAFNAEIAAIRERVSEPLPGEVRLQWWRDVLASRSEGAGEGHPLASALIEAVRRYNLPVSAFQNYLDARVFDLYDDPMPSRPDLEGYCGETAAALIQLSALILDAEAAPSFAEAAGHGGCAQAIIGLLRLIPIHRARGQCYLPRDMLAAAGTTAEEFLAGGQPQAAARALEAMRALATEHLDAFSRAASGLPQSLRPAFLPLALSPAYLSAIGRLGAKAQTEIADIPEWKRHWLLFLTGSRGWS